MVFMPTLMFSKSAWML